VIVVDVDQPRRLTVEVNTFEIELLCVIFTLTRGDNDPPLQSGNLPRLMEIAEQDRTAQAGVRRSAERHDDEFVPTRV